MIFDADEAKQMWMMGRSNYGYVDHLFYKIKEAAFDGYVKTEIDVPSTRKDLIIDLKTYFEAKGFAVSFITGKDDTKIIFSWK